MWSNISSLPGSKFFKNNSDNQEAKRDSPTASTEAKPESVGGSPLMRYKHAVCSTSSGYIYIHGGRFGNLPLDDDIWRFDPHQNIWCQLKTKGPDKPPNLQEHTLVEFNERLYLFGGQVSASNQENSFWKLDLIQNEWHSLSLRSSKKFGAYLGPTNRRGHSAVVYQNSMYIFGGYEDFRGSSAQLWEFHLLDERWELRNLNSTSACHPEARHSHSAIVYKNFMYIYGGLSDLKALNDLWCWSWAERRWFKERTKGKSPGYLHGHTAIQAFDSMFVFGGERNGRTTRSLWRLNLLNMTWRKIKARGPRPNPTTWHGAIANPLSILDEANYIIEGQQADPDLVGAGAGAPIQSSSGKLSCESVQERKGKSSSCAMRNHSQMSHSRSSSVALESSTARMISKGKSRLSFLRKRHQLELPIKQDQRQQPTSGSERNSLVCKSASENNFDCNNHKTTPFAFKAIPSNNVQHEEVEGNAQILDNLDTDIKQMFQATSIDRKQHGAKDEKLFRDELEMSIESEAGGEEISSSSATGRIATQPTCSSISNYQTAIHQSLNNNDANEARFSQRSSYAFATPPSEANTLRNSENLGSSTEFTASGVKHTDRFSFEANQNHLKRANRPKSEIVQSLIDRADARIKHLYTPLFFNEQIKQEPSPQNNILGHHQQRRERLHSVDRSKRHTIHQTTTYYNLYFSEDKTSSSGSGENSKGTHNEDDDELATGLSRSTNGGATLIGLHENEHSGQYGRQQGGNNNRLSFSRCRPEMESSNSTIQSSFHDEDSQTLCEDSNVRHQVNLNALNSNPISLVSSLTNALTAKATNDTSSAAAASAANNNDNTSLSFSVIAEFEEDDMLQYSSPTSDQFDKQEQLGEIDFARDRRRETKLFNNSAQGGPAGEEITERPGPLLAHKSASSGYDSISEQQQSQRQADPAEANQEGPSGERLCNEAAAQLMSTTAASTSDGSVRTDSSFGFSTSETSPEQSALRKKLRMVGQAKLYDRMRRRTPNGFLKTTSSTTADSLILTSDGFESSIINSSDLSKLPGKSSSTSSRELTEIEAPKGAQVSGDGERSFGHPRARGRAFFCGQKSKNRYWQLCMFVIGGKQGGIHGVNEPITIWRLYI